MRRRSRAGDEQVKARQRKAASPARRNGRKVVRRASSSAAGKQTEVERLTRELSELQEQQTATLEALKAISSSPGDFQPVFATMLENAVRICGASFGDIFYREGVSFRLVTSYNTPAAFAEVLKQSLVMRSDPDILTGRISAIKVPVHVADLAADPIYIERRFPHIVPAVALGGVRTILIVPMVKSDELIGQFVLCRQEVRTFSNKQIALVTGFADQAVIALENARLLDELRQRSVENAGLLGELRQRTDDLNRAVKESRALGEVSLAVNSTLDLENVLSTIIAKAVQLSGTESGAIYFFDDQQREFHLRATYGMDREFIAALTQRRIGLDDPNVELVIAQPEPIEVRDLKSEVYTELNKITLRAGFRARLVAPLLRADRVVGLLVVRRRAPGEFTATTIDLIKTFAAQSAVAIEIACLSKIRKPL
jgi:GAF domain-containing protein